MPHVSTPCHLPAQRRHVAGLSCAPRGMRILVRLTRELAQLVSEGVPDGDDMDRAERAVADTIAVILASACDPTMATMLRALGPELGTGPSTVLVTGASAHTRQAALIGGLAAHALDYDDVDDAIIGHPSAVIVPAVLAAGEELQSSGVEVLEGYWTGLTAGRMIAAELGIEGHYAAGWHSTSTIGTLSAAAAVARMRHLSALQAQHALGIAGSLASGSRQNFGTMTKPLHAGIAASNGVLAATLAASGFTSDPDQLEGPLGFLAMHNGSFEAKPTAAVGQRGLNVKLYPCCYYIHAAAEAMMEIGRSQEALPAVRSIHVTVQPAGLGALIHHRPVTGLQGKFSMEYAMAAAFLDHRLTLQSFTDDMVNRPEAQTLLRTVTAVTSAKPPMGNPQWEGSFAVVRLETQDGTVLERRVDHAKGHATRPISEDQLRAKFDDCGAFGNFDTSDQLYDAWRHLRELSSIHEAVRLVRLASRGRTEFSS
jgi:2-methylcitrate dehydratase PrpD